jgi:hypothetical protein
MGLQQFERRLERLVEGVFARAFRSGLQPVEVGRRLTREMDLRRTVAPRGTLAPNLFEVVLASGDRERFAPIEEELISELISIARDHAHSEGYHFLGPVSVTVETDDELASGMFAVGAEFDKGTLPHAALVLPDGRRVALGDRPVRIGRLPECELVLADPNVSRRHAEVRPADGGRFAVSDLGSTNGTKVNGALVGPPQLLRDGDEIRLGGTAIRFESP